MAPDFPYFVLLGHTTMYGHTLPGVFLVCLPSGLLVLWLFHRLFKKPLLSIAPDHLAYRISADDLRFSFGPASRLAWIAASVIIGTFTHILWDDFTHERGLFVTMAPELKLYFGLHMPLFAVLQLGSSVVGAALLAWAYWRWSRRVSPYRQPAVPQFSLAVRILIIIIFLAAMFAFAIPYGLRLANASPKEWWSVFIVKTVIGAITAGFVELCVFSIAWHLRDKAVCQQTS